MTRAQEQAPSDKPTMPPGPADDAAYETLLQYARNKRESAARHARALESGEWKEAFYGR